MSEEERDLWMHPEPKMIGTSRRLSMRLFPIGRIFNDGAELLRMSDVFESLYEARRGHTPTQLKRCVVAVVKKAIPAWGSAEPEEVRAEVSRAFAICTRTLQKGGYMKTGTQTPTKAGKGSGRSKAAEKGHSGKLQDYEKMLSAAKGE